MHGGLTRVARSEWFALHHQLQQLQSLRTINRQLAIVAPWDATWRRCRSQVPQSDRQALQSVAILATWHALVCTPETTQSDEHPQLPSVGQTKVGLQAYTVWPAVHAFLAL